MGLEQDFTSDTMARKKVALLMTVGTGIGADKEKARMQQALDNEMQRLAYSTNQQKDLADFMAKVDAKKVPYMYEAMRESGMTEKQIRDTVRAYAGSLPSWTEYLKLGTGVAKDVAGTVGGLVK